MTIALKNIGFVGDSHLAVVSAVAAAVKTEDWKTQIVGYLGGSKVTNPVLGIQEPGLFEHWQKHQHRIVWTNDASSLTPCEVVTIALDVSTNEGGQSDLDPLRALWSAVLPWLGLNTVVVVQSQVPPGFVRGLDFPKEKLFYQVETLIFGEALMRATSPERFIIGATDKHQALPPAYQLLLQRFDCPQWMMSYESAELAKMAINSYLVAMVTTSNTLAALCEAIGADWQDIVPSLQADKRIGPFAYLNPGLGLSGGNLKRDLVSLRRIAAEQGVSAGVFGVALRDSAHRRNWVLRKLVAAKLLEQEKLTVAILGLTYKAHTDSLKDSAAVWVIHQLPPWATVRVFDPMYVGQQTIPELPTVTGCKTPESAAEGADVLLIMTPWPLFQTLDYTKILKSMKQRVVIDPLRVLTVEEHPETKIWQLGS